MPQFSYITDLPPTVRAILDVPLQQVFMDTFNSAYNLVGTDAEAFQIAWMKVLQTAFPGEILTLPTMPRMAPVGSIGSAPTSGQYGTIPMSETEYGYLIEVSTFQFDENADTGWIHAMPLGTYDHPVYGKINVTPEKVQQFASNVNGRVRGTDLDIDYDHKNKTSEAAGWVKKAEARADGLWLFVEWTKQAAKAIREKAYRYFSPEFVDVWTHPKTGAKYQNVLFGGGLTNRPFLKDILPVNLSEIFSEKHSGGSMDPKRLRKLLGLPDDATDDQVQAAVDAGIAKLETNPDGGNGGDGGGEGQPNGQPEDKPEGAPEGQPEGEPAGSKAHEGGLPANIKILAENDPVVRTLMERITTLEGANRLSEVNLQLNEMANPSGGKYAVAPTVIDRLRILCCEVPKQFSDKFLELVKEIQTNGLIELGERGTNRVGTQGGGGDGTSATEQITKLVTKRLSENNTLSYADALEAVALEQPQLYDEYRNESYVRMRGEG